jgi:hypothetical protein
MSTLDVYRDLAAGDPEAVQRFAPRVASLAAEARRKRLAAAPAPVRASIPARAQTTAAPAVPVTRLSRAAQAADLHGPGINETRRRAGLAPLTSDELELEFADADREPPHTMTKAAARRAAANAMAARQGLRTDQAGIDAMWAAAASRGRDEGRRASPGVKQTQAEVDDMWTSLVNDHNRQAGLKTPSRAR